MRLEVLLKHWLAKWSNYPSTNKYYSDICNSWQANFWQTWSQYTIWISATFNSGTTPGPILLGFVLDSTCRVWDEKCDGGRGSCWVYDAEDMSSRLMIWWIAIKVTGITFFLLASFVYRAPKESSHNENPTVELPDPIGSISMTLDANGKTNPAFTKLWSFNTQPITYFGNQKYWQNSHTIFIGVAQLVKLTQILLNCSFLWIQWGTVNHTAPQRLFPDNNYGSVDNAR